MIYRLPRRGLRSIVVGLLACFLLATPVQAQGERRKVIIEDEGFGLMHLMLLGAPDIEVIGITTVSGNVWANRATALTLRGLEIAGRTDVPVAQGATFPLLNTEKQTEAWERLYGKLTWKGAWMKQWVEPTLQSTPPYHGPNDPVDLPGGNPVTTPVPEIAANFLIRMVRAHPGQITIVAAGPLTNLALAQRLDPEFAGMVGELVYMGGSFNPHQVLDNPSAQEFAREFENSPRREFNERFDPEAASIVSRSPWRKLTIVPIDPSTATQLSPQLLARAGNGTRPPLAAYILGLEQGFPLWDEIAAAVVIDPGSVRTSQELYVDYNTQFGPGYGDTLSWREGYQPGLGEQKAQVVLAIDPARVEAALVDAVAGVAKGRR